MPRTLCGYEPLQFSRTSEQKRQSLFTAKPCQFVRHKFNRTNSDLSKKTILTKTQKFNKTPPVLAPCCYGIKIKCVFLRFRHTAKFPVSPSNLKNLTASLGVERARKPSAYFFGTFFRTSEKSTYVSCFARHKLKHTNSEPSKNLSSFTPLFSEKKADGEAPLQFSRTSEQKRQSLFTAKTNPFSCHKCQHENSE